MLREPSSGRLACQQVDFRVLGPVQVTAGSGAVDLASGRQVALLCCLLVARGEVVSRDRLIDALWGERPPATAVNALQVHVHELRRRLGAERIERKGPGYRVVVDDGELDAGRFERLATRGRAELAGGAHGEAAGTLRGAPRAGRRGAHQG